MANTSNNPERANTDRFVPQHTGSHWAVDDPADRLGISAVAPVRVVHNGEVVATVHRAEFPPTSDEPADLRLRRYLASQCRANARAIAGTPIFASALRRIADADPAGMEPAAFAAMLQTAAREAVVWLQWSYHQRVIWPDTAESSSRLAGEPLTRIGRIEGTAVRNAAAGAADTTPVILAVVVDDAGNRGLIPFEHLKPVRPADPAETLAAAAGRSTEVARGN